MRKTAKDTKRKEAEKMEGEQKENEKKMEVEMKRQRLFY